MGVFQSQKTVPVHVADLAPVAQAVANHFQAKGFEVQTQSTDKGWHVSISKADTFKVVMGTKTALNVELEPKGDGTDINAGIGVFGQHGGGLGGVLAGPLMLTQMWGMVQQSKLDDEAMAVAEQALQDVKSAAVEAEPPSNTSTPRSATSSGKMSPPSHCRAVVMVSPMLCANVCVRCLSSVACKRSLPHSSPVGDGAS